VLAIIAAAAMSSASPPCAASDLTASIAGTNGAAGTIRTTVALVNVSNGACVVEPFPDLTFVGGGSTYHPRIEREGEADRDVIVEPRGAALLVIQWSDVDAPRPCDEIADVEISVGKGPPLWAPVQAMVCRYAGELPAEAAAAAPLSPSRSEASAVFDRWFEQQPCEQPLLFLSAHPHFTSPRHADSIAWSDRGATILYGGRTLAAFDASAGVIAEESPSGGASMDVTVCGDTASVPYGIARARLAAIRTARGVALGASIAHVENVDGPANVVDLGDALSAIEYRRSTDKVIDTLTVLFEYGRAIAIDDSIVKSAI
jgi:hypothetical protein